MTVTSNHSQACFEAWINCENLLVNLKEFKTAVSKKITNVIDECALICMGTFHALKSSSKNSPKLALLCIGICEECAELCEELKDDHFQKCAQVCRECAARMSIIAMMMMSEQ